MQRGAEDYVERYLETSLTAMRELAADPVSRAVLHAMAGAIVAALQNGHKLMIAGNGGSAADAQHIACEFVGRFLLDRKPFPALALTTDSSALTAIANDFGFETVFERQVLGFALEGDVFLGLSTSGNSPNVVRALEAARSRSVRTLGFTGAGGGRMAPLCDHLLAVPSTWTPVIQQLHITAAHILCALVERAMCPENEA